MCAQKCAEPRANIKKRRRHNSSTSAETVWSSRYGCGLSCRHGGESGETCKQYQCAAKDRASADCRFPRSTEGRGGGAAPRKSPPGILRPRNIPARWSGAVIPSMRGEGRGTFFQIFWFPLGTPFPFFWTPRCAPRGKPSLFRRRPQPPICLRTSRGRGVPPIAPGTTSRASSSCFAGKPFTVRRYSRHVTARLGFACDQAKSNRIAERSYDDWDRIGCLFGSNPSSSASRATADVWRDYLDNTFSWVHLHGVIVSSG